MNGLFQQFGGALPAASRQRPGPFRLFLAYALEDETYRRGLEVHLAPLLADGSVQLWHERKILPGADWQTDLDNHLEQSDVIVLLVSAAFLGSKYCVDSDVEKALLRQRRREAIVVPVIARPCLWRTALFGKCKALPTNEQSIAEWNNIDQAYLDVANGLRALIEARASNFNSADDTSTANRRLTLREQVDLLVDLVMLRERSKADLSARNTADCQVQEIVARLLPSVRFKERDTVAGAQLIHPIGAGNFATIWSARTSNGTMVAAKVFHAEKLGLATMLWRFRRGIKATLHLTRRADANPHIVPILEVDDSRLAFTMPYVGGGNIARAMSERTWSFAEKIGLMTKICSIVEDAHRLGVVHRDIKPENVLLDAAGEPMLTDFDIADVRFLLTASAVEGGLGTPYFAAPEQMRSSELADERSDIYSLGRLFHYLLIERVPPLYERNGESMSVAGVPSSLQAIVAEATNEEPAGRYQSVKELRYALDAWRTPGARVRASLRSALLKQQGRFSTSVLASLTLLSITLAIIVLSFGGTHSLVARLRPLDTRREATKGAVVQLLAAKRLAELDGLLARYLEEPDVESALVQQAVEVQKQLEPILETVKMLAPEESDKALVEAPSTLGSSEDGSEARPAIPVQFNRGETIVRLAHAAKQSSRCAGSNGGNHVQVAVRFLPSGEVEASLADAGKVDAATSACILRAFGAIRVSPFTGAAFSLTKRFAL